jgi:hypothetical protein
MHLHLRSLGSSKPQLDTTGSVDRREKIKSVEYLCLMPLVPKLASYRNVDLNSLEGGRGKSYW